MRAVRTVLIGCILLAGCTSSGGAPVGIDNSPPGSSVPSSGSSPTVPYPGDPSGPPGPTTAAARPLQKPDPNVTPGAILTTNPVDVCTPGWATAHRRELAGREKNDVLAAYGLSLTTVVAEWDHLVSLQLGGDNGRLNIWPQLDHDQDTRKDRLEGRLHTAVCNGSMTLPDAQGRIIAFWLWW